MLARSRIREADATRATNDAPHIVHHSIDGPGLQDGTMHGNKHPTKYSDSHLWGPWSEWKIDADGRYFSERFDPQGNVEYTYSDHQRTPRTEAPIDQLTAGFGRLDVNSSGYDHGQGTAYADSYTDTYTDTFTDTYTDRGNSAVGNSFLEDPASPQYTLETSHHGYQSYPHSLPRTHSQTDKGKEVAKAKAHDNYYGEGHGGRGHVSPTTNSYSEDNYLRDADLATVPENDEEATTAPFSTSDNFGVTINSYYVDPSGYDGTEYEVEQALKKTNDVILGKSRHCDSSTSGDQYETAPNYSTTYQLGQKDTQGEQAILRGASIPPRPDFNTLGGDLIRGIPEKAETTDTRFVVESSYKFQPGEVFKIYWSEPTGQVSTGQVPIGQGPTEVAVTDAIPIDDSAGQFYVGYRRFIIVSTDESHHSTCVPILTYDRRGCSKKGVRPNKHGIIYAMGQKPRPLKGEPNLGFDPVPLDIYVEGETLARESRVNYSKLVTIEHNVKVFFIGRIPQSYFESVRSAVDQCWAEKMHKSSKKSRR
ncbi:hypothetical protein SAMD00023353_4700310 [Rosellinia necatrix]|uniref:DUF6590 domain-containing protein n=1 Tax=Rosellinia necatrix TaxID=77044 RepID=A0A1W2TQQ2_ROSNE|nr:hypothetical protein SAMD00023353_4700310 [Rosellinia necatrix]